MLAVAAQPVVVARREALEAFEEYDSGSESDNPSRDPTFGPNARLQRANSKLTSSDYFMPVLGIIFLRHAANRFEDARAKIEAEIASGKMAKRPIQPADYVRHRALWLPEAARFETIMAKAAQDMAGPQCKNRLPALPEEMGENWHRFQARAKSHLAEADRLRKRLAAILDASS